MPPSWVALKAVHPSWSTVQLPQEVAELLGCRAEELSSLLRPARSIAFLARGPGVVRVVGMHRSATLLGEEMSANRVVDVAQLTDKLLFNLPDAVVRYLGLTVRPRGDRGGHGIEDGILWFLPELEYRSYREAGREGIRYSGLASGEAPHVYLTRSVLGDFRRGLEDLERSYEAGAGKPAPTLAAPVAGLRKRAPR